MSAGAVASPPGQGQSKGARRGRRIVRTLHEAQGGLCAHCFEPMMCPAFAAAWMVDPEFGGGHDDAPSVDRVHPGRYGGTYRLDNILLAHRRCNEARDTGRISGRTRNLHRHVQAWFRERGYTSITQLTRESSS